MKQEHALSVVTVYKNSNFKKNIQKPNSKHIHVEYETRTCIKCGNCV